MASHGSVGITIVLFCLIQFAGVWRWAICALYTKNNNHNNLISAQQMGEEPPMFKLAPKFRVKESWMGNHVFLCNGKIMLGSDAPLFYVTNAILIVAMILYFGNFIKHDPRYHNNDTTSDVNAHFHTMHLWTSYSFTIYVSIIASITALASLWKCATTDPSILPPVSSPIRPPPPSDSIPFLWVGLWGIGIAPLAIFIVLRTVSIATPAIAVLESLIIIVVSHNTHVFSLSNFYLLFCLIPFLGLSFCP